MGGLEAADVFSPSSCRDLVMSKLDGVNVHAMSMLQQKESQGRRSHHTEASWRIMIFKAKTPPKKKVARHTS